MALYSVYVRPPATGREAPRNEKIRLIKSGFSWFAFVFPLVWLLFQRVWGWFLVILALEIGLVALINRLELPEWSLLLSGVAVMLYVGVSARDWLGSALERRGYRLIAMVSGEDEDEAYAAFVRRPKPRSSAVAEAKPVQNAEAGSVIGLFPNPEGRL